MEAETILEWLSGISVGSIIAVCTAVSVVCVGVWKIVSKILQLYERYTEIKEDREQMKQRLISSEQEITEMKSQFSEAISGITQQLTDIKQALDEQRGTKIKELRHSITIAGEAALARGEMTVREYTSLHEMVNEYVNVYHQNWYVESLIAKVDRDVHVIGKLDEHGNDIE